MTNDTNDTSVLGVQQLILIKTILNEFIIGKFVGLGLNHCIFLLQPMQLVMQNQNGKTQCGLAPYCPFSDISTQVEFYRDKIICIVKPDKAVSSLYSSAILQATTGIITPSTKDVIAISKGQ